MDFKNFFPQDLHKDLVEAFQKQKKITLSGLGNNTSKVFFLAKYLSKSNSKQTIFWVTHNQETAQEIYKLIQNFISFPVLLFLNNSEEEIKNEIQKAEIIYKITSSEEQPSLIVTSCDLLDLKVINHQEIQSNILTIKQNQKIDSIQFFDKIINHGYSYSNEKILQKGEYHKSGGVLSIFPINTDYPLKIEFEFDNIVNIWTYNPQKNNQIIKQFDNFNLFPITFLGNHNSNLIHLLSEENLLILDELDEIENNEKIENQIDKLQCNQITITAFPKNEINYIHLRYLSLLKFYNVIDFLNDLKDKINRKWEIIILVKDITKIKNILEAEKIKFSTELKGNFLVKLIQLQTEDVSPFSFQNPDLKIELLTDKEIFSLKQKVKNKNIDTLQMEILTSLREGNYVVHFDYGIGRFLGIKQIKVDNITREYLEIIYAENDKLFVPVDQADKVSRFISDGENKPHLSRLGSTDWKNITHKVKKETQKIAKELLQLYAKRAQAKGFAAVEEPQAQKEFEATFPYEETPGQIKAIQDTKADMEKSTPMDRLICGDVGFGKTEVALRAAFKAVQNQKQVALISPITILTDQHYRTFKKRMKKFNVRIEMLSRFKTAAEQKKIIQNLKKGKVDIVIGTHRLLQPDIDFFDLGLVVIDEEQRFGVKQKEQLKSFRASVDVLTLTATPIPRTLNMSLNKLRDITTITTPPPGRLPIITEVRKYSDRLVKDVIEKEINRDGQVYFLHNRVETIKSVANKIQQLVPTARVIVAHGQLGTGNLEERIIDFKEKKYNVLVSSTIIENGIDLPNANTLIVNNTEMFGLSQLYQLRGRIGRGKTQAFAYFLYHAQKLKPDARKRLRAIVEASELGSGFQIAMKDLEIRGAGDVLGANQHGSINVVGVNHFLRLLNQTISEMKTGQKQVDMTEKQDVLVEIPLNAYIPNSYINDPKDKILTYQKVASINSNKELEELKTEVIEEFGLMPAETSNLFKVIELKLAAKKANITMIKTVSQGNQGKELSLHLSDKVTAEHIINLLQYNSKWIISGNKLKIDFKQLGFNWLEEVIESLEKLLHKVAK